MGGFSIWHILLVAIILLLLFGGNRFSSMMGDVAKGLKSFKQGMADEDDDKRRDYDQQRRNEPPRQLPRDQVRPQEPIDVTPRPAEPAAPPPETTKSANRTRGHVRRRFFRARRRRDPGVDLYRAQGPAEGDAHRRLLGRSGARHGAPLHGGIENIVREAELEEIERKWREDNERIMSAHPPDAHYPEPGQPPTRCRRSPPPSRAAGEDQLARLPPEQRPLP